MPRRLPGVTFRVARGAAPGWMKRWCEAPPILTTRPVVATILGEYAGGPVILNVAEWSGVNALSALSEGGLTTLGDHRGSRSSFQTLDEGSDWHGDSTGSGKRLAAWPSAVCSTEKHSGTA